jgi:hypothetical protein
MLLVCLRLLVTYRSGLQIHTKVSKLTVVTPSGAVLAGSRWTGCIEAKGETLSMNCESGFSRGLLASCRTHLTVVAWSLIIFFSKSTRNCFIFAYMASSSSASFSRGGERRAELRVLLLCSFSRISSGDEEPMVCASDSWESGPSDKICLVGKAGDFSTFISPSLGPSSCISISSSPIGNLSPSIARSPPSTTGDPRPASGNTLIEGVDDVDDAIDSSLPGVPDDPLLITRSGVTGLSDRSLSGDTTTSDGGLLATGDGGGNEGEARALAGLGLNRSISVDVPYMVGLSWSESSRTCGWSSVPDISGSKPA